LPRFKDIAANNLSMPVELLNINFYVIIFTHRRRICMLQ
jgi:hypothetical protein